MENLDGLGEWPHVATGAYEHIETGNYFHVLKNICRVYWWHCPYILSLLYICNAKSFVNHQV
jgi:hypothetical protein